MPGNPIQEAVDFFFKRKTTKFLLNKSTVFPDVAQSPDQNVGYAAYSMQLTEEAKCLQVKVWSTNESNVMRFA